MQSKRPPSSFLGIATQDGIAAAPRQGKDWRRTLNEAENPYREFESLSLRQQVIDIAEIIVMSSICATFPTVSVSIRANSKLRARITPDFSD